MRVVEDDGQVRDVALAILRRHGYLVIAACDADEAWQACQAHPHPIHLLLTDLVMPGITGRALGHLCMSSYDAMEAGHESAMRRHRGLVGKFLRCSKTPHQVFGERRGRARIVRPR